MDNVILEFIGNTAGAQIFRHPVSKNQIRAGQNIAVRYVTVPANEAEYYISLGLFRVAHRANSAAPSVTRRDAPKRIEPIVDEPLPVIEKKEETQEGTVVAFDETIDESLAWLSEPKAPEPVVAEEVVEEEATEEVADEEVVENQPVKVGRGRQRK